MRIYTDTGKQKKFIDSFWKEGKKVLYQTALPVIELSDQVPVNELKQRVNSLLKPDRMTDYVEELWVNTGSWFAYEMVNNVKRKALGDAENWERMFRAYMADRSKKLAGAMLDTEAQLINDLLDQIVAEGTASGASIQRLTGAMKDQFIDNLITIQNYEAERIARTEVIGASNKGSFDGAMSTGLPMKKGWSTSGLSGIRPSHLLYESWGWMSMEKEFAPGLKHPGDPNGEAGEIINCRCTIIYDVD